MTESLALRLRELRWLSADRCHAVFESEAGRLFESDFTVSRSDGIVTVSDDANLLGQIDGTAANVRAVVQAVATFCDAAQQDDQSL